MLYFLVIVGVHGMAVMPDRYPSLDDCRSAGLSIEAGRAGLDGVTTVVGPVFYCVKSAATPSYGLLPLLPAPSR